ncbi:MAG TPA: hypothetical protein VGE40_06925 [Bacilli bacterium]
MDTEDHDPYIEQIFNELLKNDYKSMVPEQSSATWEIIKTIYKKERSRRRRVLLVRVSSALSAALLVGTIIYKIKKYPAEDSYSGSGI